MNNRCCGQQLTEKEKGTAVPDPKLCNLHTGNKHDWKTIIALLQGGGGALPIFVGSCGRAIERRTVNRGDGG